MTSTGLVATSAAGATALFTPANVASQVVAIVGAGVYFTGELAKDIAEGIDVAKPSVPSARTHCDSELQKFKNSREAFYTLLLDSDNESALARLETTRPDSWLSNIRSGTASQVGSKSFVAEARAAPACSQVSHVIESAIAARETDASAEPAPSAEAPLQGSSSPKAGQTEPGLFAKAVAYILKHLKDVVDSIIALIQHVRDEGKSVAETRLQLREDAGRCEQYLTELREILAEMQMPPAAPGAERKGV